VQVARLVDFPNNSTSVAPKVVQVARLVDFPRNATLVAPKVVQVARLVDFPHNTTLVAPKVVQVGISIFWKKELYSSLAKDPARSILTIYT
jgi:hypothetical protein